MPHLPLWDRDRREMVENQLRRRGIRDERVLEAMLRIPREQFVSPEMRVSAYQDAAAPIGYGQTISQPFMTALMAELLQLQGDETVLEVGAGSGYAAAVLGSLAKTVAALEIVPGLAELARENLRRTAFDRNVTVINADGSLGYPPMAPYDAISVAAGAPDIPEPLLEQLKDPGRLVIPVGDSGDQELQLVTKRNGKIEARVATLCRFVPLRGDEGWR
jgi:protein-L-isoaspartate(D-aspartate) O-methyltransferase